MKTHSVIKNFILLLVSFLITQGITFAEDPGIRITEPINGTTIVPGQQIKVSVEPVGGFLIKEGAIGIASSDVQYDLTNLPATFMITIPQEVTGQIYLSAFGSDGNGIFDSKGLTLNVQQTATLQSLKADANTWYFETDWNGNIEEKNGEQIYLTGVYSDGIEREIPDTGTTFTSIDPSIVSVEGSKMYPHKLGTAIITISNSGISTTMAATVKKPRGLPRSETIPPTTKVVKITPAAPNAAGWYNSDITVSLAASDNQGGSGVREIDYYLRGLSKGMTSEEQTIENSIGEIKISQEGITGLEFYARDKELNSEKTQSLEFKLDKTPPETTPAVSPVPDANGLITSLPVSVNFIATDNLSGVAFSTKEQTITQKGKYQLDYYSIDIAGNREKTKTLVLEIEPGSVAANDYPLLTLELRTRPNILNLPLTSVYELSFSAKSDAFGIKELKAGFEVPNISGFKSSLKKRRDWASVVTINEKEKTITIEAPMPEKILAQMNDGLFLISNRRQSLLIKKPTGSGIWKISATENSISFEAPVIAFKATAIDNAGNISTKEVSP